MKFANKEDVQMFLAEVGRIDLVNNVTTEFVPTEEMMTLFIKKRRKMVPGLKDFRRSQATKQQWKQDRFKLLRGIKRFHKSTKGKRFHRALGRFLSTRDFSNQTLSKTRNQEEAYNFSEISDILKALSSIKTHAYIEFDYYMPIDEAVEWQLFVEELIPMVDRLEVSLIKYGDVLGLGDEVDFLCRVCDERVLMEELSSFLEVDQKNFEEYWRTQFNMSGFEFEVAGNFLKLINQMKEDYQNVKV